ncbi:SUMF1/EgtB/PvdO family nonheme iron enzyme [bacterium]|nr:SUMF1/EgtB/PvdO family nonheme iron enzyme [bacterium]
MSFPGSEHATEAQESILRLRAETLLRARRATDPHEARGAWHTFVTLFPDRTPDESCEFQQGLHGALVRIEPTPKRWREYLKVCPDGPLAREAQEFVDAYAWVPSWAVTWGMESLPNGRCWAELEVKGVRQRLRLIEPGVFLMGSPAEEDGEQNETPQHEVALTKPYWIAETECTQALWKAVIETNPSKFQAENRPVETVSWEDCTLFIKKLNQSIAGLEARLPLEAEWEYACRAGTVGPFAGSGLWQEMAWVLENCSGETHDVKQRSANAWGLHDMQGNVAEWVSDGLRAFDHKKSIDPVGPVPNVKACHRGGCWAWGVHSARSAARNPLHRDVRGPEHGFRLAVSASRDESGWVYYATGEPDIDRLAKSPEHGIFLGDLKPLPATSPYAPLVNDAWGVRRCMIGDRTCVTFVTVHPPGEFSWSIPPGALQFTTVLARADIVQTFHSSWTYEFLIDEKVVFMSPPLSERRKGIPLVIDIPPGSRRLTVITDPLGDRSYDHAILAWPYFRLRPLVEQLSHIPDDAIFLGDLVPMKVKVGSGTLNVCKDVNEKVLPIGGKPCTTFLDLAAPASVTYEIPDDAHRFTAIGSRWDQDVCAHGTWKYEIWIDGIRVFDSPALHESPQGIPIDVSIPQQARELTIVVNDFGENSFDSSILAYPCFHLGESSTSVARRIGLKPGEVAFRTSDGGWLCALGEISLLWIVHWNRASGFNGSGSIQSNACSISAHQTDNTFEFKATVV